MLSLILVFLAVLRFSLAVNYCPPLGPVYAAPQGLSTDSSVRQTGQTVSAALKQLLQTGGDTSGGFDAKTTSFSINFFSIHESESIFQHHVTASQLNTSSTKIVDENSVYRIGSITKVLTVLELLLLGERVRFDDPITKYVPELAAIAEHDEITTPQWSQITVGALAGYLAGIGRDYTTGDLSGIDIVQELFGLPTLEPSQIPSCGKDFTQPPCSRETDFFDGFTKRHPVFLPFKTPVYSNAAFQILGYVIEKVTGEPYELAVSNSILKPLSLSHTSLKPPTSEGVIPVGESGWDTLGGDQDP
ncbi:hypothetical protein MMC29_008243 [Sticta canariensis]|nr:hypothetical protein [Sticta canariensis]